MESTCENCKNNLPCHYNFPTFQDFFDQDGKFRHIKLPLADDEPVPDEILQYIWAGHWDEGGNVRPRHLTNIRISLNKLVEFKN